MSLAIGDVQNLEELLRLAGFPEVDHQTWRRRVERELGDATFAETLVASTAEGIDVEPLYTAETAAAVDGDLYLGRSDGAGARVAEEYEVPHPDLAAAIDAGQRHGVLVPWLRIRAAGPSSSDLEELRVLVRSLCDREPVVEVIGDPLALEAVREEGAAVFASDPFGEAFRSGEFGGPLDRALAGQMASFARHGDAASASDKVLVSTSAHHQAGASAVDELALALATAVEALRRLTAAGYAAAEAASRVLFALSVADDLFVEIAKLRAVRLLWWKVLGAVGVDQTETWIHARGSRRGLSVGDPRSNLLRGTVQCFAAAVGGADSIAVTPYDQLLEQPGARGRRLALMTQHILAEESHLGRFADAAAGSWYVETLADRLARAAWRLFQELERGGGIVGALKSGRVKNIIRRSAERRAATAGAS